MSSRKYGMPASEAYRWVEYHQRLFPVIAADESDLTVAVRAAERHRLAFWEAMLWATAGRAGCRVLFSEDLQDDRRLGDVLFCQSVRPRQPKLVDLALPELRT